jgi:hypothetical protein
VTQDDDVQAARLLQPLIPFPDQPGTNTLALVLRENRHWTKRSPFMLAGNGDGTVHDVADNLAVERGNQRKSGSAILPQGIHDVRLLLLVKGLLIQRMNRRNILGPFVTNFDFHESLN